MNAIELSGRRRVLALGAAGALNTALANLINAVALGSAHAQTPMPSRLLCSGPPGSIPDLIARRYAEALSPRLGKTMLVDNRPGAAGQIAAAALKQSAAEGQTMLLAQAALATVYPALYAKLSYDPHADLLPLGLAAEANLGLAVGPAVPERITTLDAWASWMASAGAQATYGSPGIGTLPHLLGALLNHRLRGQWQHVTYPGGPQAMVDLMGGRLGALVLPEGLLRPQVQSGKLRILATSGAQRSAFLPQVPSLVELGHKDLVVREWFAFFAPAGSTDDQVAAWSREIQSAGASAPLRQAMAELGMDVAPQSPSDLKQRIELEQRYWQGVLRDTGIRVES